MSIFSKVEKTKIKGNTFDLTHDRKQSMKIGKLYPSFLMDCVPGDKVSIKPHVMARFQPLIAPVMHKVTIYNHFFFVPNRLLWTGWEDFITGGSDGNSTPTWPHFSLNMNDQMNNAEGGLQDYLGIPTANDVGGTGGTTRQWSAFPSAAYFKVYNDYYRDENLIMPVPESLVGGNNAGNMPQAFMQPLNRSWQHDYFTSALPWTQRGPEALMPLGQEAPVFLEDAPHGTRQHIEDANGAPFAAWNLETEPAANPSALVADNGSIQDYAWLDPNGTMYADLSAATASSINDLRRAFRLQEWLEKNARGGARYTENITVHFGVHPQDNRLQRPEYLGGVATPMNISEVLQTSASSNTNPASGTPQGTMAGHGIAVGTPEWINYFAPEHGYIIGIMSIMPKTAYQQGIAKHFKRSDKFDYFWPEFQHIGEQPVMTEEIYVDNSAQGVFGYNPRYSEYKYINDSVHGNFRSNLDFWHMGRKFSTPPALNQDFIECDPEEVNRIFAVTKPSEDTVLAHIVNQCKAHRKMSYFGSPKM